MLSDFMCRPIYVRICVILYVAFCLIKYEIPRRIRNLSVQYVSMCVFVLCVWERVCKSINSYIFHMKNKMFHPHTNYNHIVSSPIKRIHTILFLDIISKICVNSC